MGHLRACSSGTFILDFCSFQFLRVGVLPARVSVYHIYAWCPLSQKRASALHELELQVVVIDHVGAGN